MWRLGVRFLELGPGARTAVDGSRVRCSSAQGLKLKSDAPCLELSTKGCGVLNGDVHATGLLVVTWNRNPWVTPGYNNSTFEISFSNTIRAK
jgi:hypothetical protein